MKNLSLFSTLLFLLCAHTLHGFDLAKWTTFALRSSKPYSNEGHVIKLKEGPANPSNDATRIFCAEITQKNPHGQATKDDSMDDNTKSSTQACNPATCLMQCACKPIFSQEQSLKDIIRNLTKKPITTCQGLCFFDENCTCGTALSRYNKSHPHIQLGSTSIGQDGQLTTGINVNLQACSIDKDSTSDSLHILCDQQTKLYQLFRTHQITQAGNDVTKKLENAYRERHFGAAWMEQTFGKNWRDK